MGNGSTGIVDSTAPQWTDETAWTLSETPERVIGSVDGPQAYECFGPVIDAVRLSDGRVVANAAPRSFGETGRDDG